MIKMCYLPRTEKYNIETFRFLPYTNLSKWKSLFSILNINNVGKIKFPLLTNDFFFL